MRQLVPRAEITLIGLMGIGFLLILQRWSFDLYQFGLLLVLGATVLNIAVGNLPREAPAVRALAITAALLLVVAALFGAGILLVPLLAQMGQSS